MDILRFITAGSVDDGKSTLIGRLLYDSKSILADQLEALEKQSRNKNADGIDLAILTDGLRAERKKNKASGWSGVMFIFQHQKDNLLLPMHPDMFSIPEI